jgi:hypothetical protein
MRIDALISGSINHTVSRIFDEPINCTGHNVLKFDTRASRIGKNVEFSLIDTGSVSAGITKTINHSYLNTWQKELINVTTNSGTYNKIEFKILNDDADNTIYIDSMSFGMPDIYWIDSFEYPTDGILRNNWAPVVEKEIPWTPEEISTALWLDAADSSTITESGGAVSAFSDKSGNSRNFSQATTSMQPTTGVSTKNGLNVLDFAANCLTSDDTPSVWKFLHDATKSSVFAVAQFGDIANPEAVYPLMGTSAGTSGNAGYAVGYEDRPVVTGANDASMIQVGNGSAQLYGRVVWNFGGTDNPIATEFNNLIPAGQFNVVGWLTDPGNATPAARGKTSVNGGNLLGNNEWSATLSTANPTHTLQIGAFGNNVLPMTGKVAEIIIVSGLVDTDTRQKIEGYLAWKWGLEATLPSGHPYKTAAPTQEIQAYSDVIEVYTDNSSPTYGNFSLRAETVISGSKTYGFEKEFTQDIGLKDYNSLSFDTKSNRVGENVEFSMIVDTSTSGTQETVSKKIHHNDINIWQKEIIDFSSLFDTSLFYIRKIAFNILNDDLDNIFYIDNMYLSDFQPPIDEPVIIKNLSLSIDHTKIDEDLTNFPLMISLVSGTCDIFDQLGENNLKFKIETEDGTQCYTEIEDWNYSNGKACLWTKVPTIASSVDTKLTLTYSSSFDDNVSYIGTTGSGVSYNVWDDNFVAVYHMNQDPSTGGACLLDSTSNDNDSTPDGAMTRGDLVDGDHGKALDFDGSNDHSHLPTFGVFDGSSDFTVSARIKIDTIKECRLFSFWGENILAGVFGDNTDNNIYSVRLRSDSIWSTPVQTNALSASTWYTLTVRYDTTNGFVLFVDGSSVDTSSAIAIDSYSDVSQISGQNTSSDRYFDGLISHIEISDTNRTFAWIKAAHTTLTNNLITIT